MVKVTTISRSRLGWTKDRDQEVPRAHRNYDTKQNPMAKTVEYVRAVRSAKLDRLFAKPLQGALSGHQDSITTIATDPTSVSTLLTGGIDGEAIVWDVQSRTIKHHWTAHRHALAGSVFTPDGVAMLTASRDRTVKLWDTDFSSSSSSTANDHDGGGVPTSFDAQSTGPAPLCEYLGTGPFTSIDHHWQSAMFATGGFSVDIWDLNRTRPVQNFNWGDEALTSVRFNKVEVNLVACASLDRGVMLYDTRTKSAHSKVVMEMRSSALAWNPMNPNQFVSASDDWNCYLFDIRVPGRPRSVYQGHAAPVNDVDFSPTGEWFAAGAADSTVRIWSLHQLTKSSSSDMFHTKRMSKVHSVKWSLDSNFIFSGSDDAAVRIWKADASKPVRPFRGAEESQFNYMRALKERYAAFPEVRRIAHQRNTPKSLRRRLRLKRRIQRNELIKEMSRKKSSSLRPLARKKVVDSVE